MSILDITKLDDATAAEIQKYMTDKGVTSLRMHWRFSKDHGRNMWSLEAMLSDGTMIAKGGFEEIQDCIKYLVHKIEEA